jgi:hypothetical protein
MNGHDPRLDMGRAALIAQLDDAKRRENEARAKISELGVRLNEVTAQIERSRE